MHVVLYAKICGYFVFHEIHTMYVSSKMCVLVSTLAK